MRKLLLILVGFLIPTYVQAEVVLSSSIRTTRYKTSVSATVPLSSAVRHPGGGGGYNGAWDDYWTFSGSGQYLSVSYDSKFSPLNGDFCVVIGYMNVDTAASYYGLFAQGNTGDSTAEYRSYNRQGTTSGYAGGATGSTSWSDTTTSNAYYLNEKAAMAFSMAYTGTPMQYNYTFLYDFESSADRSNTAGPSTIATPNSGTFWLGSISAGAFPLDGRIYFLAVYRSTISQAQLAAVMAGTTHPTDLSPIVYMDFHQAVAATYTSEIGSVVFSVTGTPVKGP